MRRCGRVLAGAVLLLIVAAGCGDDGGDAVSTPTGATTAAPTTRAPVTGGSITVGAFAYINGFDPILLAGSGSNGAIELAAIYDTILEWNSIDRKYVPRTAASFSANADSTVWTIKLKPGIKFGDGTDYDAAAVKFNVDRHSSAASRSPSKTTLQNFLASVSVVDPLTVQFTLKTSWAGFPYLLSRDLGMIASPAAIAKAGDTFNTNPGDAGAGPFKLSTFKPRESIVLTKNPTYHGGQVYLDQITFVVLAGAGANVDALKTGTLHGAYLREPQPIDDAKKAGMQVLESPAPLGNIVQMNLGVEVTCTGGKPAPACDGKADNTKVPTKPATSDLRVRQAVAAAIDPQVMNDRVWSGKANVSNEPFTKSFPWYPAVPGVKYDPAAARRLVQEAKTAGWDGKIRVLAANDNVNWALTVKALLEAVGMEVAADTSKDLSTVVSQMLVQRDFDLASWAYGLQDDDGNFPQFFINLSTQSPRYGYKSADMDQGIDMLRQAGTDDARRVAYKKIGETLVRDLPSVPVAELSAAWVYSPKLHDVKRSAATITLFDKVWLER